MTDVRCPLLTDNYPNVRMRIVQITIVDRTGELKLANENRKHVRE